jgi:hypothetical protein
MVPVVSQLEIVHFPVAAVGLVEAQADMLEVLVLKQLSLETMVEMAALILVAPLV